MPGARHKSDRRAELLAAAREVLAEKGLEAATVSEIVARAGVAQGTFYLYFPSKVSLVFALAEEMMGDVLGTVREATADADGFAGAIDAGVAAAFRGMGRYRDVLAIVHGGASLAPSPADWERLFEPYYRYVADLIEHGQAAGEVDPEANPELTARLVVSMIERAGERCYVYNPGTPTEPYAAEVSRFVNRALTREYPPGSPGPPDALDGGNARA